MNVIGLFPLNIVLFPESVYPLHIFEDRYKTLINESYASGKPFGINYMNNKGINHTGCSAIVSDIFKKYPDGKMDILVSGITRFNIINMQDGETPYYTAEIEYFDDNEEEFDYANLSECIDLFNEAVEKIKSIKIDKIDSTNLKTNKPSFLIAQKSGLSPEQKQTLLEMKSENQRLQYLIRHIKRLAPIILKAETINNIIRFDGYIKPSDM